MFATLIISSSLCSFKFFTPFDDSVEPGRSQSSCCGILSIMYKIVHTISLEHILVQIFFLCYSSTFENRAWNILARFTVLQWGLKNSLVMTLHVKRQMIWSREASIACGAFKRLYSGVLSIMPCKLIRSCETPTAILPVTLVRFFSSMCSLMSFEMRALSIRFITTFECTFMSPC